MQTSTQIELNLTINSINAIYSKDFQSMLLRQAKDQYEKKCMDRQYILSIERVVRRSLSNLIRRDFDAKIRVYVIVDAIVLRFDKYDTITNMHVNKIIPKSKIGTTDLLECSNNYCRALIQMGDKLTGFKVGDTIPIKVGEALLKIKNPQVLVSAYPFVPHKMEKVAYLIPKLSTYDREQIITKLLPVLESKQTQVKSVDKEKSKYFTQLLYPFKTNQTAVGKSYDLNTLLTTLEQYEGQAVYIDQNINLSDLKLSVVSTEQMESADITLTNNPAFASIIVFTFAKHLDTIASLSTTYLDSNVFEQHQYLWELYEQNRF